MRHRYACPLRWGDMDAQGHVNNGAYLDYLQEGRVDFLLNQPPPLDRLLETGVLVVRHQVEYRAPVVVREQELTVELWVDGLGASRFGIGYEIADGDVLVAQARSVAVPYDLAAQRLRRLDTDERHQLLQFAEPGLALAELPAVPVRGEGHRHPVRVRWSDLDSYGHVNNVKYFDYLEEGRVAFARACGAWPDGELFVVARQDVDYLAPLDFRTTPYEVGTVVTAVGTRSVTLAAEICDSGSGKVHAAARTVVVVPQPLTPQQRAALDAWRPATDSPVPRRTSGQQPLV